MKDQEQVKRGETNPTKEVLSDLPVTDEQALKTSGGGDVVPTDQVSVNFAAIKFEYKPQKPDGSLS